MRWDELMDRAGGVCELCGAKDQLAGVDVTDEDQVLLCETCQSDDAPEVHWRCLEGAAWSAEPAVQTSHSCPTTPPTSKARSKVSGS